MANTYEAIATVTVGSGGAANIEFTSIPQTYTDLVIKLSARERDSGAFVRFFLDINGTNASISSRSIYGTGSGVTSSTGTNLAGYGINRYTATANTFGNVEIYIPNYSGSTYKSISIDGVEENNATASYQAMSATLWSNTAAITSISIVSPGNIAQYSTATLYGIKSS